MDIAYEVIGVPGATVAYQVRGSGPVLALIGSPMGAGGFAALADRLASDHTVITYDPRGAGQTVVADRSESVPQERLAEDVAAVLAAVTADPAAVFGSSGGALTGLALVAARPDRVTTLVAHEPPAADLIADPAVDAEIAAIHQTYLEAGAPTALRRFLLWSGSLGPEGTRRLAASPEPEPRRAPEEPGTEQEYFLARQLRATAAYRIDPAVLRAAASRIVVGLGRESTGQFAHRGAEAVAAALGLRPVSFPGGHTGFGSDPDAFADRLREVLAG